MFYHVTLYYGAFKSVYLVESDHHPSKEEAIKALDLIVYPDNWLFIEAVMPIKIRSEEED